jgi:large subunit ribosomal protein L9e
LKRSFKNLRVDLHKEGDLVVIESWFGDRKKNSQIRTCASHIGNMITGVTVGYKYLLRLVYAHFPINVSITEDKKTLEIRNFLGEKIVRRVTMLDGCEVNITKNKDELEVWGNDIELVSQSCANIHQSCLVKDKDIRKFLDGIYVSEKTKVVVSED